MSTISTHVLDTAHGRPAAAVPLRLLTAAGRLLFAGETNGDGRCPGLPAVEPGLYRIEFQVAGYFRAQSVVLPEPPFLDGIGIDFGVAAGGGHYHLPLLVSPFGYSTYRGS